MTTNPLTLAEIERIAELAKGYLAYGGHDHWWEFAAAVRSPETIIALCASARRGVVVQAALQKVREDINWMLNNRQFLNPDEFAYLDAALSAAQDDGKEK